MREELHWIVRHHGVFQMYYYAHHMGGDRNACDRYSDPLRCLCRVRRVFAQPRYLPTDGNR